MKSLAGDATLRAQPPLGRMMLVLQVLGAAAMLVVWVLEMHSGVITPWDRWLLPASAGVIACSAFAMRRWPPLTRWLTPVPVATFNLYLVVTLQATLLHTAGEVQRYEIYTQLYWVPLAYGCAFVFLPLRAALAVSGLTAAGIFVPLGLLHVRGRLPEWASEPGPLLMEVAIAQAMFLVLLTAVVRLRNSHDRAQAHVELMRELAGTDMLTGLPNRRAMTDRLERAMAWAHRTGQALSVALIDIDRFKAVNDCFGHAAGDQVLQAIGETMRSQLRASDVLGRWGGEEFLLFAPGTDAAAAFDLAERVRAATAQHTFPHDDVVTISIGLTQYLAGDSFAGLVQRADLALYDAKTRGRNRVEARGADAGSANSAQGIEPATE